MFSENIRKTYFKLNIQLMRTLYLLVLLVLSATSIHAQSNRVGINTETPTEILDVNGILRLRNHPLDGETNAIFTMPDGQASTTKDQEFRATANLVADSNGVLGQIITDNFIVASVTETFIAPAGGFAIGSATNPPYVVDFEPFSVGFYQLSNNNKLYFAIKSNISTAASIDLREFYLGNSLLFPSGIINLNAGVWFNVGSITPADDWYFMTGVDAWYADVKIHELNKVYQVTVLGANWSGSGTNTNAAGDQFTVNIMQM